MRKALVVGINNYPTAPLRGCINDATAFATVIDSNGDGSPNFDVRLETDVPDKTTMVELLSGLFKGDCEIALFYFSGHGYEDELGTSLVTPDAVKFNTGVSMGELMTLANASPAKNKVIILDCCHSGAAGTSRLTGVASSLHKGVTILTASLENESAVEINGHGMFTNLLLEALKGGAADIRGKISPGSIYAFIDQALGSWDQRPVFKTNITEFVSLRDVSPRIPLESLRRIATYFSTPEQEFPLDPSHEFTNDPNEVHQLIKPYAKPDKVAIFKELQRFQGVGLVVPVDATHMYFAAMESKGCKLTALGYHYWRLAKNKRI